MNENVPTTWPWLNAHEPVPTLSGFRPVLSGNGMVSSPHQLASAAGVEILKAGGNAVDAAIATSAMLMVVCPMQCGPGGDAFWLISDNNGVHALDATGVAPIAANPDELRESGFAKIPERSGFAVTVPGAVDGWVKAHRRFGSIPLPQLLEPAAVVAERGFHVSRHTRSSFRAAAQELLKTGALELYQTPNIIPELYDLLRQPKLGISLRDIGSTEGRSFYEGDLAHSIALSCQEWDGWLRKEDLSQYSSAWIEPISTIFRSLEVFTTPPSSQGFSLLAALEAVESVAPRSLNIFDPFTTHLLVEAVDKALEIRDRFNSDRSVGPILAQVLEQAKSFSATFDPDRAQIRTAPKPRNRKGDTAHLAVVDKNGLGVSLIQSLFYDFGSCIPVPAGGFTLQNRGAAFSLSVGEAGELVPGHHPPHTLMPTVIKKADKLRYVLGCMGGDGQMQTQLQLIIDLCDGRLDPQQAVSRPRWYLERGVTNKIFAERDAADQVQSLGNKGHSVTTIYPSEEIMGHAQVIEITTGGVLVGAADPRSDGQVACY